MKWGIKIALPVAGFLIASSSLSANLPYAEYPVNLLTEDSAYYYNEDGKEILKIAIEGDSRYYVINTKRSSRNIYGDVSGTDTIETDGKTIFRPATVRSIARRKAREIESLIAAKKIYNDLVLQNIIEIPSREIIEWMRSKIMDNGKGDVDPLNNVEYGGFLRNNSIVHYASGIVADPSDLRGATVTLKGDGEYEFHSHPSGSRKREGISDADSFQDAVTSTGSKSRMKELSVSYFVQGPSKEDQLAAEGRTGIVFGMKSRLVYIYDAQGLKATLPFSFFEKGRKERMKNNRQVYAANDFKRKGR